MRQTIFPRLMEGRVDGAAEADLEEEDFPAEDLAEAEEEACSSPLTLSP